MRIIAPIFACLTLMATSVFAGDYPKSRDEKRAEEIGSILGGEGIVFRPSKTRNNSTKTDDLPVNSFLWQASKDIIEDLAPVSMSDPENGIMSTEWYSDSKDPKRSLKVKVHITDDIISPESIKTELKQKVLKDGRWLEENAPAQLSLNIEDKILRRARQLYLRKPSK
jgi:Domain of unknown function (DUF3576)